MTRKLRYELNQTNKQEMKHETLALNLFSSYRIKRISNWPGIKTLKCMSQLIISGKIAFESEKEYIVIHSLRYGEKCVEKENEIKKKTKRTQSLKKRRESRRRHTP